MPRFIASRLAIITFLFSHSHGSAAATQIRAFAWLGSGDAKSARPRP